MKTIKKPNKRSCNHKGNYCLVENGLILSCPLCAGFMHIPDRLIENRSPLTIANDYTSPWPGAIEHCGHYYFIRDGLVEIWGEL